MTMARQNDVRSLWSRLRDDHRAVSMTEFALALPVLLTLILGGLEVTNLALAHMRVSQIAMTAADNASRVRTTMDETNIEEIFTGASLVGDPIDFMDNGRIILSSLEHNGLAGADEGQMIGWQRCVGLHNVFSEYGGEGDGENDGSLPGMGAVDNLIAAQFGSAIMFVEAVYNYQPLISDNILGSKEIRYETAFIVRERTAHTITNVHNREEASCWLLGAPPPPPF